MYVHMNWFLVCLFIFFLVQSFYSHTNYTFISLCRRYIYILFLFSSYLSQRSNSIHNKSSYLWSSCSTEFNIFWSGFFSSSNNNNENGWMIINNTCIDIHTQTLFFSSSINTITSTITKSQCIREIKVSLCETEMSMLLY